MPFYSLINCQTRRTSRINDYRQSTKQLKE
jgi:hypothetical protein